MRKYEFYKLDVFTENPFAGNQLAVFTDARGISDREMQWIAAELNLSETTFVLPSEKALRRVRIFTPRQELPLAGHPVVGTWYLLARLGVVAGGERTQVDQELNLGVLPVEIKFGANRIDVTMTQGEFSPGEIVSDPSEIERFAEGLGIAPDEIARRENLPVRVVSTGIKAVAVPVENLEVLKKCRINPAVLSECYLKYGAVGCYPFTFETIEADSAVHARFFAPADAIPEDPATGSAAGSLAGYLIYQGARAAGKFTIEQGDFMNRPSRIRAEVTGAENSVERVKIGGTAVIVAKGEFYLDTAD